MNVAFQTDREILKDLGARLRLHRRAQKKSTKKLAEMAGVGESTVRKAESGQPVSILIIVRIMRGLGVLGQFENFLPEPAISPMQLLAKQSKRRT